MRSFSSLLLPLAAATVTPLLALTGGAPTQRSGIPGEAGGATCTVCHQGAAANSDSRGRLTLEARDYKPGVKQLIRVILEHPDATKWGFQLTARVAGNDSAQAGSFAAGELIRVRCGAGGANAPCAEGETQFAGHNGLAATRVGQRNRSEWLVEWTPPEARPGSISGSVIFYAAGNAANNSGTNAGDVIYTASRTIEVESCNLARPTISAIRNGASFLDGPVSFNTLITIAGSGFQAAGTTRTADAADLAGGRFPAEMGCIAVEVAGEKTPLLYAQANQINAQVRTIAALGAVPVTVVANPGTPNERRSDPVNITLAAASPAFFRILPTPCIAAVFAATGQVTGDPSLLPGVRGVRPGDIISLYATGLGALEPVYQAGEIVDGAVRLAGTVQIEWGGRTVDAADILYVGAAPGFISGLYQINLRVPGSVSSNAQNQVRLRVGGALSPEGTTIYVAPN